MRLDVARVPEGRLTERLALENVRLVEGPLVEDLHAQRRQHGVPIQLVVVAGIADRQGLDEKPASLLDIPGKHAPHRRGSLLVHLVKVGDALVGRGQVDDVKLLHHLQQLLFRAVTAIEERDFQQRRPNAALPIDGNHPVVGLEFDVVLVCIDRTTPQNDWLRVFGWCRGDPLLSGMNRLEK